MCYRNFLRTVKVKRPPPARPQADDGTFVDMTSNMVGNFGLLATAIKNRRELCSAPTPHAILNARKQGSISGLVVVAEAFICVCHLVYLIHA
jgi:hypothetical protein